MAFFVENVHRPVRVYNSVGTTVPHCLHSAPRVVQVARAISQVSLKLSVVSLWLRGMQLQQYICKKTFF